MAGTAGRAATEVAERTMAVDVIAPGPSRWLRA